MPLAPVVIAHTKSGAKAEVHSCGATVTSFVTTSGREILFVSSLAKTDGSKAIRGGIPLVFPQFGQPNKSMPQHGFLRTNIWTTSDDSSFDDDDAAGREFTLKLSDAVKSRGGKWDENTDLDCLVTLSVKVSAESLATTLTVSNAGATSFDFQTLFHTYYKIRGGKALDGDACNVSGLGGYDVEDKITNETYVQKDDEKIVVDGEVDRIYSPPPSKPSVDALVSTGEDGSKVRVEASGTVDGKVVPVSAVVWNPHVNKSKGMGDFGDEEYHDMICVEPGILKDVPSLEGGKAVVFTQVITAL